MMVTRAIYEKLSNALRLIQQFEFSTKSTSPQPYEVQLRNTSRLLAGAALLADVPSFSTLATRAQANPIVRHRWQDEAIVVQLNFLGEGAGVQVADLERTRDELVRGLTATTQVLARVLSPPVGADGFVVSFPDNTSLDQLAEDLKVVSGALDLLRRLQPDESVKEATVVGVERGSLVVTLVVGSIVVGSMSKVVRHCIGTVRHLRDLQLFTSRVNRATAGTQLVQQHTELLKQIHDEFAGQLLEQLRGSSDPEDRLRVIRATENLTALIERNVKFLDAPTDQAERPHEFPDDADYKELTSRDVPQLPSGGNDGGEEPGK